MAALLYVRSAYIVEFGMKTGSAQEQGQAICPDLALKM